MTNSPNPITYDKIQLAMLKKAYFDALSDTSSKRQPSVRLYKAEEDLIHFAEEIFTADPKTRALLSRRRVDARPQLIQLILRLSTE